MLVTKLAFLFLFSFLGSCNQVLEVAHKNNAPNKVCMQNNAEAASNIIFKSVDGGITWKDYSNGLDTNYPTNAFFADNKALYLQTPNGLFYSYQNAKEPIWYKDVSLNNGIYNISSNKNGLIAFTNGGNYTQKLNGTSVWLPIYAKFEGSFVRTFFEANNGAIFVGCDAGLFKSTDKGETFTSVYSNGWVIKMVESNGVIMATNEHGIIRSTDNGNSWSLVINEGGVGIDVEPIKGGFAAITYNTTTKTRKIRASYDGGINWELIDKGLPPHASISTIIEMGEKFYCGHPYGIYESADKGKSWKLVLPAVNNKVFNLYQYENTLYAIPISGGC
jgi:photosystem II stability/assembly factor-like uncharacterized protein